MSQAAETDVRPYTDRIQQAVEQGEVTIPPMPQIATQILELTAQDSRAGTPEIAELIRHEPAVAATVLKYANSAAFGGLCEIKELAQAVARLGSGQVTSIVTALVHKGNFKADGPAKQAVLEELWAHSVASAVAARGLARAIGTDPEEAFMGGLLHDVGKLMVLKGVDYLESQGDGPAITQTVLAEMMLVMHADLGHRILTEWHLPELVCQAALRHHEEKLNPDESFVRCIQAADAIAHMMKNMDPETGAKLDELPSIEDLGLAEVELAALLVDMEDELAEINKVMR